MTAPTSNIPPRRWKRALGRLLDTAGFTVDEWRQAPLAAHHDALVQAIRHILACLQIAKTQSDLLERDTLAEDWTPWLQEQFGDVAAVLSEADPVAAAYGIRWCEIVLARQFDVEELLANPPEPVVAWTRDVD
ncbi:MAG: hypothetical protein IRZ14_07055 [Chloroflexi bacterium]|nr:hypothetical protein [Chloroflexota bacterium]